jgi:murein DD-endopeptidase MepM/ murein hydrolase activator NlpD
LAIVATVAVSAAGCSDSSRFDNPFSSRSAPPGEVTGSVKPSRTVQSKPLPPPAHVQAPATRPAVTTTAGGSPGMAIYQPPAGGDITGTVPVSAPPTRPAAPPPQAVARRGWTWEGGTPIEVAPGETAHTLSKRYGVPVDAIVKANNLPDAAAVKAGQRLVIPRHDSGVTGSVNAPRPAAPPTAAAAPREPFVHVVAPGETLSKISRQYKKSVVAIAKANNIPPHTMVKMGDRIVIPGMYAPAAAPKPQAPVAQPREPAPAKVASAPPAAARSIAPAAEQPAAKTAVAAATFRWPVRGRVISGFGVKTSGQQNDGINVAVPEGTPIKAAEDGVVAYAGNELKTYGNLVLIRHSNGYVTAYAHASEILVKRDDPIRRGQVIAKAGQTGNVAAPQLHFEIRKGSSPVDPMPYLDKGGAI